MGLLPRYGYIGGSRYNVMSLPGIPVRWEMVSLKNLTVLLPSMVKVSVPPVGILTMTCILWSKGSMTVSEGTAVGVVVEEPAIGTATLPMIGVRTG